MYELIWNQLFKYSMFLMLALYSYFICILIYIYIYNDNLVEWNNYKFVNKKFIAVIMLLN